MLLPSGVKSWTTTAVTTIAGCAAVLASVACASGCSRKSPERASIPQTAVAAVATEAPAPIVHGLRKLANIDTPVYVDGKQVSVLRFGELPPGLVAYEKSDDEYHQKRFYRLYDYLKAIGVDVDRVRAVHLMSNQERLMSLEGSELRADKARFVFDFQARTTGLAKVAWDTTGLKNTSRNEEIRQMIVFVSKPVAKIDDKRHCYLTEAGQCDGVAPYSDGELAKGTRVYVDGKLAGYVKRRLVSEDAIVGTNADGTPKYSLDKFLAQIGVDASSAKGVDLLWGDEVLASARGDAWKTDRDAMTFALARHQHGKVQVTIPADLQAKADRETAKDRPAQITCVEVFKTVNPPSRPLVAVDEDLQTVLASSADGPKAASDEGRESVTE